MGSDRNVARQIELNVTGMSFTGTSFPFLFEYELRQLYAERRTYVTAFQCVFVSNSSPQKDSSPYCKNVKFSPVHIMKAYGQKRYSSTHS
jgi:hypothetical protein